MSTVKTDEIVAVSTNGDLSLDGLGTGGVSIASTLKMAKGGDIASASPLVIDTDGNYFDVTGTTNFSVMTVESGNFFMLQFDGALTITHGSGIELPGAANLTTATGDRLMCYATAANTVEVMSVETEAAAGGGGVIGQVVTAVTASSFTNTTTLPVDDTIPQSTEGDEILTLAITPANSSSKLVIFVTLANWGNTSAAQSKIAALFKDSGANAIFCVVDSTNDDYDKSMSFHFTQTAGSTSSQTFKLRVGSPSGSLFVNRAAILGGNNQIVMTIWEVLP